MITAMIAGKKLKLTVEIMDGDVLVVKSNLLPTSFLFHDGYGALLRLGTGKTAGTVELHRIHVGDDPESIGHIETLLSA